MKILCPTDFSSAASNGIEYAANLAQRMNATLTLLNVQPLYVGEGINLYSGGEIEAIHEAKISAKTLDGICLEINNSFKVLCEYEIITSMNTFEIIVAEEAGKFDFTVIGTNGADNMYQFYFGSHSFRVANRTTNPVLIIPEKSSYKEINKIVFASDYNKGDELLLGQLKQFAEIFNPQLVVLHISEKDDPESVEVYNSFCTLTKEKLNYNQQLIFERILDENKAGSIESFMDKSLADILAVYPGKHGFIYRMFHENLVKRLTSVSGYYPVLVMHK